jgi:hypothetical protein
MSTKRRKGLPARSPRAADSCTPQGAPQAKIPAVRVKRVHRRLPTSTPRPHRPRVGSLTTRRRPVDEKPRLVMQKALLSIRTSTRSRRRRGASAQGVSQQGRPSERRTRRALPGECTFAEGWPCSSCPFHPASPISPSRSCTFRAEPWADPTTSAPHSISPARLRGFAGCQKSTRSVGDADLGPIGHAARRSSGRIPSPRPHQKAFLQR